MATFSAKGETHYTTRALLLKLYDAGFCLAHRRVTRMEQPPASSPDPQAAAQPPDAEAGLVRRQGARLQARLRPIVQGAAAIIDKVRLQAVLAALAGVWLWALLFYPFASFGQVGVLVLGLVVLALFVLPALVLLLFWLGLRELIAMPDKLITMAGQSEAHTGTLLKSVAEPRRRWSMRWLWRFFRTVLDLRGLLLGSKEVLLQAAVVARVANPVFLAVLFVAFVLSLLLIVVAAVSVLVVIA